MQPGQRAMHAQCEVGVMGVALGALPGLQSFVVHGITL
jgi:hypothetical protein